MFYANLASLSPLSFTDFTLTDLKFASVSALQPGSLN
jgi:hypothetical protein